MSNNISLSITQDDFDRIIEYLEEYANTCWEEYSATDTEKEVYTFVEQLKTMVKKTEC